MEKTYKRFRIEFSGKNFPEYYPSAIKITADDDKVAKEWSDKQLQAWGLSESKIRVSIVEIIAPSEPEADVQPKPDEKAKPDKRKGNRKK